MLILSDSSVSQSEEDEQFCVFVKFYVSSLSSVFVARYCRP